MILLMNVLHITQHYATWPGATVASRVMAVSVLNRYDEVHTNTKSQQERSRPRFRLLDERISYKQGNTRQAKCRVRRSRANV